MHQKNDNDIRIINKNLKLSFVCSLNEDRLSVSVLEILLFIIGSAFMKLQGCVILFVT